MSAAPAIEARALAKRFGTNRAVDTLDFAVQAGELYGLVGPDGAGKTTTLRLLAGLVTADGGEVHLQGQPTGKRSAAVREAIGYMPQQYSLYGDLSIEENLSFFGKLFGLNRADYRERERRLLEVTRLGPFRDRRADALSGGMYKKLALACALLHRPRVLLLDEPTNGVDPVSRRELWDLLYEFVHDGMAVVLATPYMDEASRCHRVGLLHHGRKIAEGEPAALVRNFPHSTFAIEAADRDAALAMLQQRPEVIALSPQGAGLRVVVSGAEHAAFTSWAALVGGLQLAAVAPDFEDVFLGLEALADASSGVA